MAFTIKTYWNLSDNNYVNKDINEVDTLSGVLKNESDVVDPVVLIESNHPNKFNYVFIEEFARYYYVTEMNSIRNNLVEIHLHVDVLMTYKAEFLALNAVISRNTHDYNVYLPDDQFSAMGYERVQCREFPNSLEAHKSFIFVCAD